MLRISSTARACPPRAERRRGLAVHPSSPARRPSRASRNSSCARSSTNTSTSTGLLTEETSQQKTLEEAVLGAVGECLRDLRPLEQRSGSVERPCHGCLSLAANVVEADLVGPRPCSA